MPSLRLSCPAVSLQTAADGDCRPTEKEGKEEEEREEEEKMIKGGNDCTPFPGSTWFLWNIIILTVS